MVMTRLIIRGKWDHHPQLINSIISLEITSKYLLIETGPNVRMEIGEKLSYMII